MDRSIKNYKEPAFKRASTKDFLKHLKHKREIKKQNKKSEKHYKKFHPQQELTGHIHENPNNSHTMRNLDAPEDIKIVPLALVVDNIVVDIMRAQESFAENLLQEHKFIKLDPEKYPQVPQIGFFYKDDKFFSIDDYIEQSRPTSRG